jgi:phosphate transport system substrate-binding protein
LPAPLYRVAIAAYFRSHFGAREDPSIFYNEIPVGRKGQLTRENPLGSEEGVRQFLKGKLNCAGTDWPLPLADLNAADVIEIPVAEAGVAIVYNLPYVRQLNLSASTLSKIFLTKNMMWDDARIKLENPSVAMQLPHEPIYVVHRNEGSGTTRILGNFLTKLAGDTWTGGDDWLVKKWVSESAAVEGSAGMAAYVRDNENSIGYVEYLYAVQERLAQARVLNSEGQAREAESGDPPLDQFIQPSITTMRLAVPTSYLPDPEKAQESFPSTQVPGSYPVSGFTWLLIRRTNDDSKELICKFLEFLPDWLDVNAQVNGYASVPQEYKAANQSAIRSLCSSNAL